MRPAVIAVGIVLVAAIGCRPSDQSVARDELQLDPAIETQSPQNPTLTIVAQVTAVNPGNFWSHYTDGSFKVADTITFTIVQPRFLLGKELDVNYDHPNLPDDSPLRKLKTFCRFSIENELVTMPENQMDTIIYSGALKELTILHRNNP